MFLSLLSNAKLSLHSSALLSLSKCSRRRSMVWRAPYVSIKRCLFRWAAKAADMTMWSVALRCALTIPDHPACSPHDDQAGQETGSRRQEAGRLSSLDQRPFGTHHHTPPMYLDLQSATTTVNLFISL